MTYCLALRLDEGLVFLADTRTNAGIDDISTYRKQHVLRPAADRVFVLESAGSLATTHEVLDRIQRDLETPGEHESLATVERMFDVALYVGRIVLGGQIGDAPPDILLVYPEGNCIRASEDRPFLQIGESKYGKFMLEVAVTADADLDDAVRIALGSMMSTARANLSVGPPYDVAIHREGAHDVEEVRVEAGSALLAELSETWDRLLVEAVSALPHVTRERLGS
jgi:putative proteasome-type protease